MATIRKNVSPQSRKSSSSSSDRDNATKSAAPSGNGSQNRRIGLDYTENPIFTRYWETEKAAQSWLRSYRQYTQGSPSISYPAPIRTVFIPPPPLPPPLPPFPLTGALISKSTKKSKKRKISDIEASSSPKVMEVTEEWRSVVSISSGPQGNEAQEEEEAEAKMDLSDDVLAFMTQTIRHRIEREKKKAYEQEIQDQTVVFVPADRPFMASRFNEFGGDASAVADMLLRRGSGETPMTAAERRRQEMIRLYGNEAAGRLQAEETLMQMKFDQEYDKYHPPFWPNIPLKL